MAASVRLIVKVASTGLWSEVETACKLVKCVICIKSRSGGIDFQNINMARGRNRHTGFAFATWFERCITCPFGTDAVQAAGQQPRRRGFADTANACQNEGMRKPAE